MRLDRKKFAYAMIDADLNTKQLAELSGITRATVSNVKNGKSCSYDTAVKLANALKVPVEKLVEKGR